MSPLTSLAGGYLQSIMSTVLQGTGVQNDTNSSSATSSVGLQADNSQLSPFAQLMSTLQQLQQTDPTKYQQVTQQIATNLQSAAQTAQSQGNTTAANQLNQLSTDFTTASKTGQLPNIQDLAQAMGSHGHHHHHHSHSGSSDADSSSSSGNSSSSSTSPLSQLLSAVSTNSTQSDALNPMNIILNTLSNAGISTTNT
ncbi:MAG TPA: hypothetical protein VG096_08870 [Bryobacteraceae bacterium]|jgi:hypothetical protein|nr:hypothetical protein [Bryobacteraceae bacterium]